MLAMSCIHWNKTKLLKFLKNQSIFGNRLIDFFLAHDRPRWAFRLRADCSPWSFMDPFLKICVVPPCLAFNLLERKVGRSHILNHEAYTWRHTHVYSHFTGESVPFDSHLWEGGWKMRSCHVPHIDSTTMEGRVDCGGYLVDCIFVSPQNSYIETIALTW